MSHLKFSLLATVFLSGAAAAETSDNKNPSLAYAELEPEMVLHDSFANAEHIFLETTRLKDGSLEVKHGRFDPTIGIVCEWDKAIKKRNVTIENVVCVQADAMPPAWEKQDAGQFGDHVSLLGDVPRKSHFDPNVIFETFGAVNNNGHVLVTTRIWDTVKGISCLSMREGYQDEGNVYASVSFGCYPVSDKTYMHGLMKELGMSPT